MNKQEYIAALEKLNLPKTEFIILSGGSLLMHGLRETSADLDLCASKKLAKQIDLYHAPKDEKGFFAPFENCQMIDDFENFEFDIVDGYQCETLESVLAFKKKKLRPKDLKDIENIEKFLANSRFKLHGVYRHFKGGLYILEDIIYHSETKEKMVAYRALYGDGRLWCRPYDMFFEEVDHKKYPDVKQKYRFELHDIESVVK